MTRQRHFDFAQLDPKAALLDLLFAPAGKFDLPILTHARPVASPIESRVGLFAERRRNEFLSGQFRTIQVTATDTGATYVQFAGLADITEALLFIEDVNLGVGDGCSDGNDFKVSVDLLRNAIQTNDARGFGLSKHVNVPGGMLKLSHPRLRNVR